LLKLILAIFSLGVGKLALAMSVVFINPGKANEIYWLTASRAMAAAAKQLGVQLEVMYAERNHLNAIVFARQIAARPKELRPDYVILSNDYASAPEVLRLLDAAGVYSFLAFSGIAEQRERALVQLPRQRYPHWLGSLEPDSIEAGYLTMQALAAQALQQKLYADDGKIHVLAIAGDRATTTSRKRNQGMLQALASHPELVLDQLVYGEWQKAKASEQARWLYQRHPKARVVWSGNDLMAFGAMESWRARGGKPGQDMLFCAINTSVEAFAALRQGQLHALAGGHFIAGAFALVMLYDHQHGRDFIDEGMELTRSMFILFSERETQLFLHQFSNLNFEQVNFRQFSKALNPAIKQYQFSFRQILEAKGVQGAESRSHRK